MRCLDGWAQGTGTHLSQDMRTRRGLQAAPRGKTHTSCTELAFEWRLRRRTPLGGRVCAVHPRTSSAPKPSLRCCAHRACSPQALPLQRVLPALRPHRTRGTKAGTFRACTPGCAGIPPARPSRHRGYSHRRILDARKPQARAPDSLHARRPGMLPVMCAAHPSTCALIPTGESVLSVRRRHDDLPGPSDRCA